MHEDKRCEHGVAGPCRACIALRCGSDLEEPTISRDETGKVHIHYPKGPLGGERWRFRDLKTGEIYIIECLTIENGPGELDTIMPVEKYLRLAQAAAYLQISSSTLYYWKEKMHSTENRGSLVVFQTSTLVNYDLPMLASLLTPRADVLDERAERAQRGEILRPGRHTKSCERNHSGPTCPKPQRRTPDGWSPRPKKSKK